MFKNNDGKHIVSVVERTKCNKHQAAEGYPCWDVYPDTRTDAVTALAVCGSRIRAAGYVGKISETSVQTKRKLKTIKKEVSA